MPRKKTDNICSEPKYAPGVAIKFNREHDANSLRLKFGTQKFFNQYSFEYLINPIVLRFKQSVCLKNMKHAIKVVGIQNEDAEILSKIIRRMHAGIRLRKNDTSITRTNAVFKSLNGEYMEPAAIDGKHFMIDLEIQGYKTSENGFPTPIWSIVHAQEICL